MPSYTRTYTATVSSISYNVWYCRQITTKTQMLPKQSIQLTVADLTIATQWQFVGFSCSTVAFTTASPERCSSTRPQSLSPCSTLVRRRRNCIEYTAGMVAFMLSHHHHCHCPLFSTLNPKDIFSLNPSRHRPHPFHRTAFTDTGLLNSSLFSFFH